MIDSVAFIERNWARMLSGLVAATWCYSVVMRHLEHNTFSLTELATSGGIIIAAYAVKRVGEQAVNGKAGTP